MANVTALENRSGSTTQYQASWFKHRVRHVSHRIKQVAPVLLLPVTQIQVISTSSSRKSSAFHLAVHNEPLRFRLSISTEHLGQPELTSKAETLKYAKQFEHDYDNDNYSNYVEDVSVHTGDSYQSECAMARIYWDELGQLY